MVGRRGLVKKGVSGSRGGLRWGDGDRNAFYTHM